MISLHQAKRLQGWSGGVDTRLNEAFYVQASYIKLWELYDRKTQKQNALAKSITTQSEESGESRLSA